MKSLLFVMTATCFVVAVGKLCADYIAPGERQLFGSFTLIVLVLCAAVVWRYFEYPIELMRN
jgi:hypothetical protein